jgi:hypothetical protein
LRDAPAQAKGGHQDSVRHFDNQEGREWLPCELGDRRNGTNKRVLVSLEVGRLFKTKDGTVAKDSFIQNLQEVDPDEYGEDDFVGLATNAFVLLPIR